MSPGFGAPASLQLRVGRGVVREALVLPHAATQRGAHRYPKHFGAKDFTLTVIDRPVHQAWLEKRLEPDSPREPERADPPP